MSELTRCAPAEGSTVEIACGVSDQPALGIAPVRPPCETIQHRLCAAGIQLEHYSERCAAVHSSAIEIASRVSDQTRVGLAPVRSPCEAVQHHLRAARIQLEDDPAARC